MTKWQNEFETLANHGRTDAGSAIVDAVWSTPAGGSLGTVLILNHEGKWKAYTGFVLPFASGSERADALHLARYGAKVPFEIAFALFGKRGFGIDDYDGQCVDVEWATKLQAAGFQEQKQ